MKKIIILIFIFLVPIKLNAIESYVVMDTDSGRVLKSLNMDETALIASTTKIMTAIVAIENMETTKILCAGEEIKKVYGSMIYIEEGECLPLYDLLVGLLLRSGNDAAMVIATKTLGYDKFIEKMNLTAIKIGMKNTNFSNPHGLDDEDKNTSTAYDLALLMRYATKNKVFMEIDSIKKFTSTSTLKTYLWYNKNKLLNNYKYATGGKIGYTTKSGHIFVSSATKAKEDLVIASIKDEDQFNNHKKLYEEVFKEYDKYKILDKYTFNIKDDKYINEYLYIKEDVYLMLNKNELNNVDIKIELLNKEKIKNEEVVGKVKIFINDEFIKETNIYAINREQKKNSLLRKLFFWKK